MNSPALSVIVISYNTRELTLACLRSVFMQTSGFDLELLVVDNASADGSADAIAAEFPQVTLIRMTDNLGFAAANNLAAERARGEYLLLLNPDTVVLDGAIQKLLAFARAHPGAGIWGGRTVYGDGSLNPTSCWNRQTVWSLVCRGLGLSGAFPASRLLNPEGLGGWARDCEQEVDIITGCFLLIRREMWEKLGGFDPAFFMYGEEADLCLRARRLGARPMFTPAATIVHYGGASEHNRADKLVKLLRAKALLVQRHWHPTLRPLGYWLLAQWCFNHALAWRVLRASKRGQAATEAVAFWSAGWRRRAEWWPGSTLPTTR